MYPDDCYIGYLLENSPSVLEDGFPLPLYLIPQKMHNSETKHDLTSQNDTSQEYQTEFYDDDKM
jgi:hypothetical protein